MVSGLNTLEKIDSAAMQPQQQTLTHSSLYMIWRCTLSLHRRADVPQHRCQLTEVDSLGFITAPWCEDQSINTMNLCGDRMTNNQTSK